MENLLHILKYRKPNLIVLLLIAKYDIFLLLKWTGVDISNHSDSSAPHQTREEIMFLTIRGKLKLLTRWDEITFVANPTQATFLLDKICPCCTYATKSAIGTFESCNELLVRSALEALAEAHATVEAFRAASLCD
eukprot:4977504-Pleurochrysis_carterae.AAC.2